VNLAPFACQSVSRSELVERFCYDTRESYLVNLRGNYYHYCEIPRTVVSALLTAPSMGQMRPWHTPPTEET
jgi:KTSC domain